MSGPRWNHARRPGGGATALAGSLTLALALLMTIEVRPAPAQDQSGPAPAQVVRLPRRAADLAVNRPSRFAWEIFVRVNKLAPPNFQTRPSNNAVWETWVDDPINFPKEPDPNDPPQWPGKPRLRTGELRSKVELSRSRTNTLKATLRPSHGAKGGKPMPGAASDDQCQWPLETVHRNYEAFHYIIKNKLWYQEGIAEQFRKAAALAGQTNRQPINQQIQVISFPVDSIEVKANWMPIQESDKPRYHWNYLKNPTCKDKDKPILCGLVAMHISSKILPQWFWCTFEHVDNTDRSDFIGSYDDFGVRYDNTDNPSYQPPRTDPGKPYAPGEVTDRLIDLFRDFDYKGDYLEAFKNYRLKGTQTEYTTTTGLPTQLGNSITEQGFAPTSSCITCHARAAANSVGQDAFPVAGLVPFLPPGPNTGDQALNNPNPVRSYNGPPDPSWYWTITFNQLPQLKNLQMDFVWAIPFKASPAKKGGSGGAPKPAR